jgi:hypothetical protein
MHRRPLPTTSSFAIEDLDLHFIRGTPTRIAFKNLGPGGMSGGARAVKPDFLYDPLREIQVYEFILPPLRMGSAVYQGSFIVPDADRYWLFLEWIDGVELYQIESLDIWQMAARWLARLHARGGPDALPAQTCQLLTYDAAYFRQWILRAAAFSKTTEMGTFISSLATRYDRVVERLLELPATLVHGEAYPSNILVVSEENHLRICPVDWEMAGIGPRFLDIAALTNGEWSEDQRKAIAMSYLEVMGEGTGPVFAEDEFLEAVDYCRLHFCVQWLGWSAGWVQPPHHTHNWFQEAVVIAERLGL